MKRCPKCGELQPFESFGYTKQGKVKSWCRSCTRAASETARQRRIARDPAYLENRRLYSRHVAENKPQRMVRMFHSVRNRAKRCKIPFILIKSDIESRLNAQNWRCAQTMIEFDLTAGRGKRPFGPAVDRIDPRRGYEPGNIQIVCNIYNYAKNEFSDSEVVRFALALAERHARA